MSLNHPPADAIGWAGVLLIIVAYGLNTAGVLGSSNFVYLLLNLFGAAALCYSSFVKRDWQPVILNVIWILIAIYGIFASQL